MAPIPEATTYMCYNVFTIKINLFKYIIDSKKEGVSTKILGRATLKAIIQGKYSQGWRSSYQSAGADPLLLKCSLRGREAVVGLRAFKINVCPFFPCGCLETFLSHF